MRVDDLGGDRFAGGVDHGDLHPGAVAGVESHRGAGARGRGEQQITQVGGEDVDGVLLGGLAQPHPGVDPQAHLEFGAPSPAHGVEQPAVGGATTVGDTESHGDATLVDRALARFEFFGIGFELQREDVFLLPAQQRENPVRRQFRERLAEFEVVGEFRARLFLARAHRRDDPTPVPHQFAQFTDQIGVLGEALDQDRAGAVELFGAVLRRVGGGVADQGVGHRLVSGLAGDLGLGAPLGLVRQVDVLEAGLGLGRHQLAEQRVVEFALPLDGFDDRAATLVEFAQIVQAFVELTQLRVVESVGDFLAVPRDERHGRTGVEQFDGRSDLALAHTEFLGDASADAGQSGGHGGGRCGGRRFGVRR